MAARVPEDLDRILHDLRGPLNAAAMHVEVLKRVVNGPPSGDTLKTLQAELERLGDMLAAAIEVVAIERADTARIDLRAAAKQALARPELASVELADAPWPPVFGDAVLLTRAIEQLALNAVEASAAAKSKVPPPRITAERNDDTVAIVVRDFGPGLRSTNPKVLIRLAASKKPGHRGTGLLTAERIARLHGGALRFGSPGEGAEVAIVLPARDQA
jgi:signal transduction histidine kinase